VVKKFNMTSLANDVKKHFKGNEKLASRIGVGTNLSHLTDADFLKMPQWWFDATGHIGLPYGKMVQIAGDSDSGKTTAAIAAMKAAQEQGVGVIYVETEGKTTEKDLLDAGIDTSQILLVQSGVAEEAFELMFAAWDGFKKSYPDSPLLVVVDSFGNVVSQRDSEIDISEQNSAPGGKGKINRLVINKMVAKRDADRAAILAINYTYDNMGSPGKTNAGGKALNFFSCLTFQTSRKGWYEKQVSGKKVRCGVDVSWKIFKDHLNRTGLKKKESLLRISGDGVVCLESE